MADAEMLASARCGSPAKHRENEKLSYSVNLNPTSCYHPGCQTLQLSVLHYDLSYGPRCGAKSSIGIHQHYTRHDSRRKGLRFAQYIIHIGHLDAVS